MPEGSLQAGRAKTNAEHQRLCDQREFTPNSHRSRVLNPNWLVAVDLGRNCRLWKQVWARVRTDQSLSWPHSDHSRSRDLPRNIGWLPQYADWLELTMWWGHWQLRPQENILLTTTLYIFLSFFFFILFYCCSFFFYHSFNLYLFFPF